MYPLSHTTSKCFYLLQILSFDKDWKVRFIKELKSKLQRAQD